MLITALTKAPPGGHPSPVATEQPDPAFATLLADPRSALRPPRAGTDMAAYRARLDAPMAAVAGPASVHADSFAIGSGERAMGMRRYRPPASGPGTILFLHGGGFIIGSLDTHDALCRSLAVASGHTVIGAEYRLAPEAPYPAARLDGQAALSWLARRNDEPIALCGDSAGGHLAAGLALDAAAHGIAIEALCLLYPAVAPGCDTGSWQRFGEGHLLTRDWMRWAWSSYLRHDGATSSDLRLEDLSRLPDTLIVTAGCDPLRDEGEAFAGAINAAGGRAACHRYSGMIHGFASLPMLTTQADAVLRRCGTFISQHMR